MRQTGASRRATFAKAYYDAATPSRGQILTLHPESFLIQRTAGVSWQVNRFFFHP